MHQVPWIKNSDLIRDRARYTWYYCCLLPRQGMLEAHCGSKETGISNSGEYSLVSALLVATISPIKQPLGSIAEKPLAKQPMGQEHSSTSQQTTGLKSYWTDQSQVMKLKVRFNNSQQIKIQDWWLHRWILSNIYRGINTSSSKIIPKNCRGRTTPKLILWGHHHPDTKPRQRSHTYTHTHTHTQITSQYYWWTKTQTSSRKY